MRNYGDKIDKAVAKELGDFDVFPAKLRTAAGLLAAVQAIGRALKTGETRAQLLAMCKKALQQKEMWASMPPHAQANAKAAEKKHASTC